MGPGSTRRVAAPPDETVNVNILPLTADGQLDLFMPSVLAGFGWTAGRRGYELVYLVGWVLGERERAGLRLVPEQAWQIAIDGRGQVRERRAEDTCANPSFAHRACWIEEAHVTELTGLLREGRTETSWPAGPPRCGSSPAASGRIPARS
jgi:hypothetical protein